MAVPSSPNQPFFQSPALARNHQRRGSARKSFSSFSIPSAPQIESPRTLCPRDGDAFSYDPSHLPAWYIRADLWDRLPQKLQSTLAAMQHAGAAVLTGFERLGRHGEDTDGSRPTSKPEDEILDQLDDLPRPRDRTTSTASSVFLSDVSSPELTGTPNSEAGSPTLSASRGGSPVSPISLSPADSQLLQKRSLSRERSFSTPLEPHDAYYATELSHLRTEALPRLRHAVRKVDAEWNEAQRTNTLSADDVNEFRNWLAMKQCKVQLLNEKCKRLSMAIGISPSGMGWTAP